jgi:hypothetical protein
MTAFFPLFIIMSCSFIMINPIDILLLMLGTKPLLSQPQTPYVQLCHPDQSDKKLEMDKLSYLSTMLLSVIALRFRSITKYVVVNSEPLLFLSSLDFIVPYSINQLTSTALTSRLFQLR